MDINYRVSAKIFGSILCILGIAMSLPFIVGMIYNEHTSMRAFAFVLIPSIIIGLLLIFAFRKSTGRLKLRDGAFIVSISWFLCALIGSLPFFISGSIPHFLDAFFETCSGFSTTGSTILKDIEVLPHAMLFWRTFTHWLGGMGILVFTIALLPTLGVDGQQIAAAEVPGPTLSKIVPKISDTARYLYIFYLAMTLLETILLMLGGMDFFDAICHSFSTLGTGGFGNYNDSITHFDSVYIDVVVMVFMFLAGMNFNLFFVFYKNGLKTFYKDGEWKLYVLIIFFTSIPISLTLYAQGTYNFGHSFIHGFFQDVSLLTTTGFATSDFTVWPMFAQLLLFSLFFVGGCSSSTAGGIKVIRILVLLKLVKRSIKMRLHPNAVVQVKVNNNTLSSETVSNIANFLFLFIGLGMFGAFLISFDGFDFASNLSASFSCLGNIGPGFSVLGSTENFGGFSDFSKTVLSFLMIAGRLELFTLLMLFTKKFWNPFH